MCVFCGFGSNGMFVGRIVMFCGVFICVVDIEFVIRVVGNILVVVFDFVYVVYIVGVF